MTALKRVELVRDAVSLYLLRLEGSDHMQGEGGNLYGLNFSTV